jgi:very-short-patch-repair endonuclease
MVDHIPVLNPAATLCLLGRVAPVIEVERCLDEFTRSHSMTWLHQTHKRLNTGNCRGAARLSTILSDPKRVDGVTESWFERLVADLLNHGDLPPIELQYPIEIDGPGREFRIDIAFPSIQLGIEAHSRSFHWGPDKADADNRRDLLVSSAGWQLLYVTWSQVKDRDRFVAEVAQAVRARQTLFAGETGRS